MPVTTTHNHYHLVGIEGVGMAALALILADKHLTVTGSDTGEGFETREILQARSITIFDGFSGGHVQGADVVVYTGAHDGEKNSEVVTAREKGITVQPLAVALGDLSREKKTIAICGCHGKTTTTALAASIAHHQQEHPSWYVGATTFNHLPGGAWNPIGNRVYMEADEYVIDMASGNRKAKFLELTPHGVIATRYDYDHIDAYPVEALLQEAYATFFARIPKDGFLVVNGDDEVLLRLTRKATCPVITVGFSNTNEVVITSLPLRGELQQFSLSRNGEAVGNQPFTLSLSGLHNVLNTALVLVARKQDQLPIDGLNELLSSFTGVHRRLEKIAQLDGVQVYDDYAHHPTEIAATIAAARQRHPQARIAVLFQPHTYSRTSH
ncbi:MAG: Mur ligase family protein, partial [Candidatus Roizmanbacteria bacterium]|nr:Mur ligase family protein [Candidatus Roizmanbacteria bacterium]